MKTIADLFTVIAQRSSRQVLFRKEVDQWTAISSEQFANEVCGIAGLLLSLGLHSSDRVGLIARGGPDWPAIDFAILCMGAVTVAIDPTYSISQLAYVLNNAKVRICFVETQELSEQISKSNALFPYLEMVLCLRSIDGSTPALPAMLSQIIPISLPDLLRHARAVTEGDLATIVYTSGTTSNPKGVMITHGNLAFIVLGALSIIPLEDGWTVLSALSPCYLFERTQDYCYFYKGCTIAYCATVLDLFKDAATVKPQVFAVVPRLLERWMMAVRESSVTMRGLRGGLFLKSLEIAKYAGVYRASGRSMPVSLWITWSIADRILYRRLREAFGGRFQYCVAGGAPLSLELASTLWGIGITTYEGYGLTEASPTIAVNRKGNTRLGTVGKSFPGVEVRLSPDGEILARGPNIMHGYTDELEDANKVIDADGWLHTGDIGHLDEDGFLRILGRTRNIIVTSYGEKIVPEPIEELLKSSQFIQEAVVLGHGRPFYIALLCPKFIALDEWAMLRNIPNTPRSTFLKNLNVNILFRNEVDQVNSRSSYDPIQAWILLEVPFSVEGGELTITQKVRRGVVEEKYQSVIDDLYNERGLLVEGEQRSKATPLTT